MARAMTSMVLLTLLTGCVTGRSYTAIVQGLPEYTGEITYLDRIPVAGYEQVGILAIMHAPAYSPKEYIENEARKHGADTIVLVKEFEARYLGIPQTKMRRVIFYRKE